MNNKYRLSFRAFDREEEKDKEDLEKVYFLSVEGNVTEVEYFKGISANREFLGIDTSRIDVKVLRRGKRDTNSAPQQVIELLEEYVNLRALGQDNQIEEIPKEIMDKYGVEFIQRYLDDPEQISKKQQNTFVTDLMKIGYYINYRKYLNKYNSELDEFCILIDRDKDSHSQVDMLECIRYCKEKGYKCYISNPCFEFWLLLHLSDVETEYMDRMNLIKENPCVSKKHTFVSKEVSDKVHHGKSKIHFEKNYLPAVDLAIQRAKKMAGDEEALVGHIGCNIWKLLEDMRKN